MLENVNKLKCFIAAIACLALAPVGFAAVMPTPGFNLGNTLESTWGYTPPTQALINSISAAGFKTLRVPCAWHFNSTNGTINSAYMQQVFNVVNWALADGMYVVINDHWDTGWFETNSFNAYDPNLNSTLTNIWTQVGNQFKSFDSNKLAFACANEPGPATQATVTVLYQYYQNWINLMRASGGGNANRWLVIQAPCVWNWSILLAYGTNMPTDSAKKLMIEEHTYDPGSFTTQSSDESWGNMTYFWGSAYQVSGTLTNRNCSSSEEESYMQAQFTQLKTNFEARGYPVLIGEWAAQPKPAESDLTGSYINQNFASVTYYDKFMENTILSFGFSGTYFAGQGDLFDATTGAVLNQNKLNAVLGISALPPIPGLATPMMKLTGAVIGSSGSYGNSGNTITNAFDGNTNTFYDAANATGDWAGLDLGSGTNGVVTQVKYCPRAGWAGRMVGGQFQGANVANFSSGVVTLFTVASTPPEGTMTVQAVTNATIFRYLRYIGPANAFCDVAEVEFDGFYAVAPSVATNLSATASNAAVILSWNGSAGADSYLVKRSTTSGSGYVTIASGVNWPSYLDTGLVNGTTYYYVVAATNVYGVSPDSTEASATPGEIFGWWKFDATSGTTAADSGYGGNPGTLQSGATWVTGVISNAVHLDGTANGYVSLPAGLVSALNDFTISTWVKVDANATWARVFDFGSGTGTYMFLTPASGGGSVRYSITTSGGGGEQQLNRAGNLSTGVWHHLAVTLSGSTGVLYVDGVPANTNLSMTLEPSSLGSTTQNYIGKSQYSDPNLTGSVDDLRIYSRALSATEVAALANPVLPAPTGLAAVAGNAQVALNWNAVTNAASYNLKRSLTNGGPYTVVATGVTATNYSDTGLAAATTYYYVVSAVNIGGESTNSTQVSASPTSSVVSSSPLPPLIHRYSFNETSGTIAHDSVGTANGTLNGSAIFDGSGHVVLNGTSGTYVSLPGNLLAGLSNVTLEAWVTNAVSPDNVALFSFDDGLQDGVGGGYLRYVLHDQSNGRNFLELASGGGNAFVSGNPGLGGQSVHVACVYTATNAIIYTNGVLERSLAVSTPLANVSTNSASLGRSPWGSDPWLAGSIDEFRIYAGAMLPSDLATAQLVGPNVLLTTSVSLTSTISSGNLNMNWPVAGSGFTLVSSPTLGSGAVWTPVNLTPSIIGANNQVSVIPTNATLFFRLQR